MNKRYFYKMYDVPPSWKELDREQYLEMLEGAPGRARMMAQKHPENADAISYVFAEYRTHLTLLERTCFAACDIKHHVSIVRYLLVDEVGNAVLYHETSHNTIAVFNGMAFEVAMDNWRVEL